MTKNVVQGITPNTLFLDATLVQVERDDINVTVEKIKGLKIDNLELLTEKIFVYGTRKTMFSEKYAKLAKRLCFELPASSNFTYWSLKEYINRRAYTEYEYLLNYHINGIPLTSAKAEGMVKFIAYLYIYDIISAERLLLWLKSLNYNPQHQQIRRTILITIKNKIFNELFDKGMRDGEIIGLFQLMMDMGIVVDNDASWKYDFVQARLSAASSSSHG